MIHYINIHYQNEIKEENIGFSDKSFSSNFDSYEK